MPSDFEHPFSLASLGRVLPPGRVPLDLHALPNHVLVYHNPGPYLLGPLPSFSSSSSNISWESLDGPKTQHRTWDTQGYSCGLLPEGTLSQISRF